ncbi:MAG: dihydroorotate dehydrogenase [Ruminococcaceae bacterium]|nr:dihydroorotate dehydrogenase [Oscillospiraceae bacterium]
MVNAKADAGVYKNTKTRVKTDAVKLGKKTNSKLNTKVILCGVQLDNPIIPASGTFGYGYEFAEFYDINCLGSLSFKGTTREARFGNPTPRIAECESGMINAIGLQNPGIDAVINAELPKLREVFSKPIMANISGFSVEEYAYIAERLDEEEQVEWLEVNISCPNVRGGGMVFGTDSKAAVKVTKAIKAVTTKPVIVKLSPNVTDITEIAKAVEGAGADGVSLINTLIGMRIDLNTKQPIIANTMGGFSGPAVFPIALRMVYQVYEAVKIPIVGIGGVSRAEDVIEMMLAGATAVQIGTANLINPFASKEIVENLLNIMEKYKIKDLKEIIGGAH